ncbi:MAG TPA: NEW3 domain-containing protein, partial [Anaerolineales bacterium]|nr:NEW3 domain-containing protein [Anaerolineales bacterium]
GGNQWATTAPATVGPVASGASASLPVMVTIPANQVIGTSDVVTVTVTSQSDNAKSARAVLTTTSGLLHGVVVAPPTIARSGNPGAIVTYTLTVVNTGNALDQYDVSVSSAAWTWTTTAPTTIGPLAGGASASVTVAVTIPGEAEEGQTETAALTVTSRSDPTKSASSTLTTTATAMPFRMFLPVVRR